MFFVPFTIATLLGISGVSYAGSPDDAAVALSRFRPGGLPASATVLEAIEVLATEGGAEHIGLLTSLTELEGGPVRAAAQRAFDQLLLRRRHELRARAAKTAPGPRDVRNWIKGHGTHLRRPDGTALGRTEQEMVAYAALALTGNRPLVATPSQLSDAAQLIQLAEVCEDRNEPTSALARYAMAAAAGHADAVTRIQQYGIDPERLLLGLALTVDPQATGGMDPMAVEILVVSGSVRTVAVLAERARSSAPLTRLVALDALVRMLRTRDLPPGAHAAARRTLERATQDPTDDIRDIAQTALAEMTRSP